MMKWIVVVLALAGAAGGVALSIRSIRPAPVPRLSRSPVENPYTSAISGAGLVEPASENIVIGAPEPGLVTKMWVGKGTVVKKGDPLFQIDVRALEAERVTAESAVRIAEAELLRVKAFRRAEEEPALKARVDELKAAAIQAGHAHEVAEATVSELEWAVKQAEARQTRAEAVLPTRGVSEQEVDDARFLADIARSRLRQSKFQVSASAAFRTVVKARAAAAQGDLDIFRAGPWAPDVARAEAAVAAARAALERITLDIERRIVRSPIDATVLRCYLHEGEYVVAGTPQPEAAALVIGDLTRLRVRVDVDEFDVNRFRRGASATAFFKGHAAPAIPLSFDSMELFVGPKRALTNSQRELVDVRVLQVIYALTNPHPEVFAGQQLDVFIEASDGSK
jgi:multidrug efflux pump subunit AcrA (membrane-fusion protein)